jgi:hypothetical protein
MIRNFWPVLLLPAALSAQPWRPFLLDPSAPDPEFSRRLGPALTAPIVTVVDKARPSPSGDPHDYISYARYWWPDPEKGNGLPYIQRDGHHNLAQVAQGDAGRYWKFVGTVETLALGWARLHREDCAVRAGEWLRAWLVAPATRMKPGLEYSQIRLGHDFNRGASSGVLDGRGWAQVVDALRMLRDSKALTDPEQATVEKWFADHYEWLTTSRNGRAEQAAENNHGSWYLVQAVAIARYLGRDDDARRLCAGDRARIGWQIQPDGSQPKEIARADGLHYSAFNLEPQLMIAWLAAPLGVDLWNYTAPAGGSLKKALAFLLPYNLAPQTWPHHQLARLEPGFLQPVIEDAARLSKLPAP